MLWRFSENAGEFTLRPRRLLQPALVPLVSFPMTYGWRMPTHLGPAARLGLGHGPIEPRAFLPDRRRAAGARGGDGPTTFVDPFYAGGSNEARSYGRSFAAIGEHQLAPRDLLGARLELERSTNYTPNRFLLYVRFAAARPPRARSRCRRSPRLPGFQY